MKRISFVRGIPNAEDAIHAVECFTARNPFPSFRWRISARGRRCLVFIENIVIFPKSSIRDDEGGIRNAWPATQRLRPAAVMMRRWQKISMVRNTPRPARRGELSKFLTVAPVWNGGPARVIRIPEWSSNKRYPHPRMEFHRELSATQNGVPMRVINISEWSSKESYPCTQGRPKRRALDA